MMFRSKLHPRSFIADRRGVAAVEFALALPLIATLLMGLCNLGEALISDRMTVEAAEAMIRAADAMIAPAQCSITTSGSTATQSCTPASLSTDSINTLSNIMGITMTGSTLSGTNLSNVDAVIYRVVNQDGTYTVANTFIVSGSGAVTFSTSSLKNYLPVGGSTLVACVKYKQTMLFPFFSLPLTLTAQYSL
ncbi:TadE/TadG family type IV pilus assembly protein [Bradyrhizobium sp. HKCCYLRH3095]|uniref:TadE/TadG family type IV pilus assembly protein n=1 Tax=unclassified Bradyrhizobium TaxID=2631580 RepID=UPI003EB69F07